MQPFEGLTTKIVSANESENGLALVTENRTDRETESARNLETASLVASGPVRVKQ